jgi:hypothetical protein
VTIAILEITPKYRAEGASYLHLRQSAIGLSIIQSLRETSIMLEILLERPITDRRSSFENCPVTPNRI